MRSLFIISLAMLLFISCKKEEEVTIPEVIPPVEDPNYFPLEIGSYWVYENYRIDSLGIPTDISKIDSLIITKDTIVNNKRYSVFEGEVYPFIPWKVQYILRDSAGYIVNLLGKKIFSHTDFNDPLEEYVTYHENDTLYTIRSKMEMLIGEVEVKAGSFSVLGRINTFRFYFYKPDTLEILERDMYTQFAHNIGMISDMYHYVGQVGHYEKRLLRYHIAIPIGD
ncbi:MAG: hypothetical protein GQ527_10400 [Bacteroidales bacterium]|nr:hypothetical protein [Bacteroidales bacterium]